MDASIVVATFGDPDWQALATRRAIPSALALGVPVIAVHDETLARARNAGLEQVQTEWVIHLDADDELTPGYLDAMANGTADLRAPAVEFVRLHQPCTPSVPRVWGHEHDCTGECLTEGNWLVVGAAVRTELARAVGGWEEWPVYEDWALWLRLWLAGATVEAIPDAVYRAHWRRDSRNRAPAQAFKHDIHRQIAEACGVA